MCLSKVIIMLRSLLETFTTPWISYAHGKVCLMKVRPIHSLAEWFSNFNGHKTHWRVWCYTVPGPTSRESASGGLERALGICSFNKSTRSFWCNWSSDPTWKNSGQVYGGQPAEGYQLSARQSGGKIAQHGCFNQVELRRIQALTLINWAAQGKRLYFSVPPCLHP